MSENAEAPLSDRLRCQTERYLDAIADCVSLLPQLLDGYPDDDYRRVADSIRTLEGDCDERNRQIRGLVSNARVAEIGPQNTRIHLNSTRILELYRCLDDIANTAERLAEEFVTIKPRHVDAYFARFREMADCATTAMDVLTDIVTTFIRLLCSHTESGTIADGVRTVRGAESSCDRIRNELVEGVFADDSVAQPMVYREFALLFDRLLDTIEDATDELVLIASSQSWITAEK